jgi:hypothetical protein
MKKTLAFLSIVTILMSSCNNSNSTNEKTNSTTNTDTLLLQRFFPVTSYIKGQLFDIKERGINPLKYTTVDNKTDSVWVKAEELESTVAEFLTPVIDSTSLIKNFMESKFFDQSINAVTLTYEPVKSKPDSISLVNWTVYINKETGNVNRIYMVKKKENTTTQLTWLSDKWCKIITINNTTSTIEKEVKLNWDF